MAVPIRSERYQILRSLGAGGMGLVYEALDRQDQRRVALKTVRQPSGQSVYRIKQEFRALADIQHENLVRLDELHVEDGQWFITMEVVDGVPFSDYVGARDGTGGPALSQTVTHLDISARASASTHAAPAGGAAAGPTLGFDEGRLRESTRQVVAALSHLHELGRVHCDIKPSNVLVTPEGRVVVLDFGLTRTTSRDDAALPRGRAEGTVAYMAPEQARGEEPMAASDYYALGSMLYEILAGQRPFIGSDLQVLADKQRRRPTPPSKRVPGLPADLERLCMELLHPDPGERPDAAAILALLGDPSAPGAPGPVPAEGGDVFVGRGGELLRLRGAVAAASGLRGVLLRGEAGVGKTALARAFLRAHRAQAGAVVLTSRCHEQEALPLKAFDGMIDGLSRYLLALDEAAAALFLPPDISALVKLFPVLQRVPAGQRFAPDLGGGRISDEQRRRAAVVLRRILQAISRRGPLVLFIDDLQWADDASFAFLADLLDVDDSLDALLLATCRPVSPEADPVARLSAFSTGWTAPFDVLTIEGLPAHEAGELLRRTGGASLDARQMQDLVAQSQGHPLLLKELARYLSSGDRRQVAGVTLLAALEDRIARLGSRDQRVLEALCLAGAPVSVEAVAEVVSLPVTDCVHCVRGLAGSQLVQRSETHDRRVVEPYHDRVRECVERRFATRHEERRTLHHRLGLALLSGTDSTTRGGAIFAIANNLNLALDRAVSAEQRMQLSELNREAGRRAIEATAYGQALRYLGVGIELLPEDPWGNCFDHCFELHVDRMLAQYLDGGHAAAERSFETLAERAERPQDIGRVYTIRVGSLQTIGDDPGALAAMRAGLARLGRDFPARPGKATLILELLRTGRALDRAGARTLLTAPPTENETSRAAQRLMGEATTAGFRIDKSTMALSSLRGLREALEHGPAEGAGAALTSYAHMLGSVRGKPAKARGIAELGHQLADRFPRDSNLVAAKLIAGAFVLPLHAPYERCLRLLQEGYEQGIRNGDGFLVYAMPLLEAGVHELYGGMVTERARCARQALHDNTRRGNRDWAAYAEMSLTWAEVQMGTYRGDATRALDHLHDELSDKRTLASFHYHVTSSLLHGMVGGDPARALASAERGAALRHQVAGTIGVARYEFAMAWAAGALLPGASKRKARKLRSILHRSTEQFAGYARFGAHFRPRHALLQALDAVATGAGDADALLERAVATATQEHHPEALAMSLELTARHLAWHGRDVTEAVGACCRAWESMAATGIADRVAAHYA